MATAGCTCRGSAGVDGAIVRGVVQVEPPAVDTITRISDPAVESPKKGLVDELSASAIGRAPQRPPAE